jgi:fructose-specific phosphotransferase system IIC component
MKWECTKKFLKYTTLGLLVIIMLASFVTGAASALVGILVPAIEGNVQYLLLIPVALFCTFIGFVVADCINTLAGRWHTE